MNVKEFDLLNLAEDVSLQLAEKAREREVSLIVFMEPELPKLLNGDEQQLAALLRCLTSSAISACKHGCDIGIAISAGDPSHDSTVGHTSIRFGITYTDFGAKPNTDNAEAIAEQLQTDIHFRQQVSRGSEFYFVLHMKVSPDVSTTPLYALNVSNAKRTFVISNEPAPNRSLHLNMRYWGFRCDGAPTMQEGMLELTREAALGSPYDLLVVAEPIDDGSPLQIASIIKNSDLRDTKLVRVDRFYSEESKLRSYQAGFDAYIAKPFMQKEFLKLVAQQLGLDTTTVEKHAPHSVLVVDDNLTNQKLAVFQLRRLELDASVAANGRDALNALAEKDFALILLDYDMPIMNGLETLTRIRNNAKYHELPVVMVTASSDPELRQKCLEAGATEFLLKPLSSHRMKELVEAWVKVSTR